jgi:hypothetical protein
MIYIIIGIILIVGLTFWLPYRQGKKELAFTTSILLALLLGGILLPPEAGLFYILLVPIVLFSLIFITYWTLVNLGLRKAGKIVTIAFTTIALLPLLGFAFEDYLFFKSNAKELLKGDDIVLHDSFKIKSNQISGIRDYYQKFELEISPADKNRIIEQFRHSPYFTDTAKQEYNLQWEMARALSKKVYKDYEEPDYVCRESYEKLKEGYAPNYDVITISKTTDILTFERIND